MSIVIWQGMNSTPSAVAASSSSLGLATLYFLARTPIIHGPMPMKFILLSLRWLDAGPLHEGQHLLHPVLAGDALLVLDERLQAPERHEDLAVGRRWRPAVEARIMSAQIFSSSPL